MTQTEKNRVKRYSRKTVGNCLKNIREAAVEVASWPPWKVKNIRLAFSETPIKVDETKPVSPV
jgi:hypothetical protein